MAEARPARAALRTLAGWPLPCPSTTSAERPPKGRSTTSALSPLVLTAYLGVFTKAALNFTFITPIAFPVLLILKELAKKVKIPLPFSRRIAEAIIKLRINKE
jgi:hypothetical protein